MINEIFEKWREWQDLLRRGLDNHTGDVLLMMCGIMILLTTLSWAFDRCFDWYDRRK